MKNFISKIPLGDNKFAFHQEPAFQKLGSELVSDILARWTPPKIFYHLRNGGHVAALNKHKNSTHFSHFDIRRFFYQVTKNKIVRSLNRIGFSHHDAIEAASHSVVHVDNRYFLPYGFTQSPMLASLCLFQSGAGKHLMRLRKSIIASVYVDDVILSAEDADELQAVSEQTIQVFDSCGFSLAPEKTSICQSVITSFNVELGKNHTKLTTDRMAQFFEQVLENRDNEESLRGIYAYIGSINCSQQCEIRQFIADSTGYCL